MKKEIKQGSEKSGEQSGENKKKILIIIIVFVLVLLLAVIGVLAYMLLRKDEPEETVDEGKAYVIDESNYQQIVDDMHNEVQEGYFETYMNFEWTFPDGASESTNAILGNSPSNTKPIRCEVLLRDSEEVVLTTGVIPVGAELPEIKLDVKLEAGVYDAVCTVYLLDEVGDGTYTEYSNAGFNLMITVEN